MRSARVAGEEREWRGERDGRVRLDRARVHTRTHVAEYR